MNFNNYCTVLLIVGLCYGSNDNANAPHQLGRAGSGTKIPAPIGPVSPRRHASLVLQPTGVISARTNSTTRNGQSPANGKPASRNVSNGQPIAAEIFRAAMAANSKSSKAENENGKVMQAVTASKGTVAKPPFRISAQAKPPPAKVEQSKPARHASTTSEKVGRPMRRQSSRLASVSTPKSGTKSTHPTDPEQRNELSEISSAKTAANPNKEPSRVSPKRKLTQTTPSPPRPPTSLSNKSSSQRSANPNKESSKVSPKKKLTQKSPSPPRPPTLLSNQPSSKRLAGRSNESMRKQMAQKQGEIQINSKKKDASLPRPKAELSDESLRRKQIANPTQTESDNSNAKELQRQENGKISSDKPKKEKSPSPEAASETSGNSNDSSDTIRAAITSQPMDIDVEDGHWPAMRQDWRMLMYKQRKEEEERLREEREKELNEQRAVFEVMLSAEMPDDPRFYWNDRTPPNIVLFEDRERKIKGWVDLDRMVMNLKCGQHEIQCTFKYEDRLYVYSAQYEKLMYDLTLMEDGDVMELEIYPRTWPSRTNTELAEVMSSMFGQTAKGLRVLPASRFADEGLFQFYDSTNGVIGALALKQSHTVYFLNNGDAFEFVSQLSYNNELELMSAEDKSCMRFVTTPNGETILQLKKNPIPPEKYWKQVVVAETENSIAFSQRVAAVKHFSGDLIVRCNDRLICLLICPHAVGAFSPDGVSVFPVLNYAKELVVKAIAISPDVVEFWDHETARILFLRLIIIDQPDGTIVMDYVLIWSPSLLLTNQADDCFMNATLQLFFNLPPVRRYLHDYGGANTTLQAISEIFRWPDDPQSVRPVRDTFPKECPNCHLESHECTSMYRQQHDPTELMVLELFKEDDLQRFFTYYIDRTRNCTNCGKVSDTDRGYHATLEINVHDGPFDFGNAIAELEQNTTETLEDYKCETCHAKSTTNNTEDIDVSGTQYLLIVLRLFQNWEADKFVPHLQNLNEDFQIMFGYEWQLAGVIEHKGSTPNSGHYKSATREDVLGGWMLENDDEVHFAKELRLHKMRSPYVLCFEKLGKAQPADSFQDVITDIVRKFSEGKVKN